MLEEEWCMNITYTRQGDYYIPDLTLPKGKDVNIGRFGLMRLKYLKNNKKVLYVSLLMSGKLEKHLEDTDNECKHMLENIMDGLKKKEEITEKLKENDGLEWVKRMNMIRTLAEEIVTRNLIYI